MPLGVQKVFVIDAEGKPCLPCHPARSRKLLDQGKATVSRVLPYTIQLKRTVEKPIGSFSVGIDDGAKMVGVSIKNEKTNEIVFKGEIELRQDVSRLMEQRRNYRRARRYRNVRCRQPRFGNRIRNKIAPSIRCRKDSSLRWIDDMSKRVEIEKIMVEEVAFNHAKHRYGKMFSLVEIGKTYLREQIKTRGYTYGATHGYETKAKRLAYGLAKRHSNDAIAIVCQVKPEVVTNKEWCIKPRRSKIWENNPTKSCTEKNGFRHYDVVKSFNRTKGCVIGSIRSLKKVKITIRTSFDDNFAVVYKNTTLLERPRGLIYV